MKILLRKPHSPDRMSALTCDRCNYDVWVCDVALHRAGPPKCPEHNTELMPVAYDDDQ
jgi:hypothetical protein